MALYRHEALLILDSIQNPKSKIDKILDFAKLKLPLLPMALYRHEALLILDSIKIQNPKSKIDCPVGFSNPISFYHRHSLFSMSRT
jgi:hypothetical protein